MAIENIRFEIYFRFIWIQTSEFFTFHGGYLLTLYVPGVEFSVVGLDHKIWILSILSFLFIVVIVI